METKLEIFMGILSVLCFALFLSVVVAHVVKWVQLKLKLRKEEKELGRIVQQQKRWENLEKELAKFDNNSAIDMASDPKPWTADPTAKAASGATTTRDLIQEAPHTMWCPRCGSHKRHIARATGGVCHLKCEDCGQRYRQSPTQNQVVNRYDRNAVPTDTPSASSQELHEVLDSGGHWPGIVDWPAEAPASLADPAIQPEISFGGGNFGGSGAGANYDSSGDSDSSSTDTSSSSDYSSSND